jgi:undecaprenyl-diphosphatase
MTGLVQNFDRSILLFINDVCGSSLIAGIANIFTYIGYGAAIWIVILVTLSVRLRSLRFFLYWGLVYIMIFTLCDLGLKNLIHRSRPFTDMPFLVIRTVVPSSFSFPSSHAAYSGASLYMITLVCKTKAVRAFILALAIAVAVSRLVLLVHYPSDVICGFFLGMFIAWVIFKLMRREKDGESWRAGRLN